MKTVLITGISRGIGRALAEKFLDEEWCVLGTSQTGSVDYSHNDLKIFRLELSSPESIQRCVDEIRKYLDGSQSKIDILINNAGALFDDEITILYVDLLRKTLEVNLIGTADFTEQIIKYGLDSGHVLFISSSAGSITETDHKTHSHHPNQYPAYKISKAGLNMYMRTLAMRLNSENKNITVSSVHPGWVKTDMGGEEATMTPTESAENIYNLAISKPETGKFWFRGETYPW